MADMEGFLLITFAIVIYLAPWFIATGRNRHNSGAIFALNLFLGWSLIGWVVALVWALSDSKPPAPEIKKTTDDSQRVACPQCAELILPAAKICKHCGSTITH